MRGMVKRLIIVAVMLAAMFVSAGPAVLAPATAVARASRASAAGQGAARQNATGQEVRVGAVPVVPPPARVLGAPLESAPVSFDIVLLPRDPFALRALALGESTPGSPYYRHFLTTSEFARRFGQPHAVIAGVDAALRAAGLSPGRASANGLVVPVTTTVRGAAAGLRVSFRRYLLASGRIAMANLSAPRLPVMVARVTEAVLGLSNLAEPAPGAGPPVAVRSGEAAGRRSADAAPAGAGPQPCAGAVAARRKRGGWTFDQLAKAYSFTSLYAGGHAGAGTTIALFELGNWSAANVAAFQKCYKTHAPVTTTKVDGGATGKPDLESTGDIETVIGLAPAAKVQVYEAPGGSYAKSTIDEFTKIADDDKASVVSTSWASCEQVANKLDPGLIASEDTVFQQAAVEGMSVFAASGDTGSEGCDKQSAKLTQLAVMDPASQPFVTGVGGTDLTALGPPPAQKVWNTAKDGAGGGGISAVWKMPSWQKGRGVISKYSAKPCPHTSSSHCREVPDVSASAASAHGYLLHFGLTWTAHGGTSFAAPLWAALLADIDSRTKPAARQGFLNPRLYALSKGTLHDITAGNNDYLHSHHGLYPATSGYDLASGLGSPDATKLAKALVSPQGTWKAAQTPAPAGQPRNGGLTSLTCPSKSFCVAVGGYTNASGHQEGLLVTGAGTSATSWRATQVPLPAGAAAEPFVMMTSVACSSPSSCVAVGYYHDSSGIGQGLLVTGPGKSGTSWQAMKAPLPPSGQASDTDVLLKSVACAAGSSCVAVGDYQDSSGDEGLLLTSSGNPATSWTPARAPLPAGSPADVDLLSVACQSASACTAVGGNQRDSGNITQQGLLLTGLGATWSVAVAPLPRGAYPFAHLNDVTCPSKAACEVGGYYIDPSNQTHGLLLAGIGSTWTARRAPVPADANVNAGPVINSIDCVSASSCLAIGEYSVSTAIQAFLLSETGSGWTAVRAALPHGAAAGLDVNLTSATCVTGPFCLAVGYYYTDDTSTSWQAMLLTGWGTSWTAARAPVPGGSESRVYLGSAVCAPGSSCLAVGNYGSGGFTSGLLVIGRP